MTQIAVLISIYMWASIPVWLGAVSVVFHWIKDGITSLTSNAVETVEHIEVAPRRLALVGETK